MPQKLPRQYVEKLNAELSRASAKHDEKEIAARWGRKVADQEPVGMLKTFEGSCAVCGQATTFTVDGMGYCKCTRCQALANFRCGIP